MKVKIKSSKNKVKRYAFLGPAKVVLQRDVVERRVIVSEADERVGQITYLHRGWNIHINVRYMNRIATCDLNLDPYDGEDNTAIYRQTLEKVGFYLPEQGSKYGDGCLLRFNDD